MIPVSRGKEYVQAACDTVLEHNNRFASCEMPSGLLEGEVICVCTQNNKLRLPWERSACFSHRTAVGTPEVPPKIQEMIGMKKKNN